MTDEFTEKMRADGEKPNSTIKLDSEVCDSNNLNCHEIQALANINPDESKVICVHDVKDEDITIDEHYLVKEAIAKSKFLLVIM